MKKLIIAASLVCVAALVQAATVTWGTDAFYKPVDAKGTYGTASTDKTAKGTVTGYLWEITDQKDAQGQVIKTAAAIWAEYNTDPSKIYTEFAKADHGALGATTIDSVASGVSRNVIQAGTTDWGVGDTAYAVLLYTYNDGSKDWYVANAAKVDDMGTSLATVASLQGYKGGSILGVPQGAEITGWTAAAVPEPTSGLLLLLGVAGLALRRRRA